MITIKTASPTICNFVLHETAELNLSNQVSVEMARPYKLRFATRESLARINAGAELVIMKMNRQISDQFTARRKRAFEGFVRMAKRELSKTTTGE